METGNKEKKIGVFCYEMLGTAFIMYAMMLENGVFGSAVYITFAMMMVAWNVSGGHFNPAITLGVYVAEKDFKGNAVIMGLMIVGQFAGAFLGVLFGYLALVAKDY